jgi:hypothetical protein
MGKVAFSAGRFDGYMSIGFFGIPRKNKTIFTLLI